MTTTKQATIQTIMVEVATASLIGKALNYAVATVEGWEFATDHHFNDGGINHRPGDYWSWWHRDERLVQFAYFDYSSKWAMGGPLVDLYKVAIRFQTNSMDADAFWQAQIGAEPFESVEMWQQMQPLAANECADTALIAICLAVVAAKLGDTVSIPIELVEASV